MSAPTLTKPDQTLRCCGLCGGWFPVTNWLHWCPPDTSGLTFCVVELRWSETPCTCCEHRTK